MNLSRKWLNEFVKIDVPDREFAEAMTLSGSKVEGTSLRIAPGTAYRFQRSAAGRRS